MRLTEVSQTHDTEAEQAFEEERQRLRVARQTVRDLVERAQIDPAVADVVRENLQVFSTAIGRADAALDDLSQQVLYGENWRP